MVRGFDDAAGAGAVALPSRQLDVRGSDYELSALGQDFDAEGCVEQVLVAASRTLLLTLASFVGAWTVWH